MIGRELVKIRKNLNYKSARAFYSEYLNPRTRLDFNYSYYMKIEGGKVTPSAQIILAIGSVLDENSRQSLILSYCKALFPKDTQLFNIPIKIPKLLREANNSVQSHTVTKQNLLNGAQISAIAKTQEHYIAFLIITLARRPISRKILGARINPVMVDRILSDLQQSKLIFVDKDLISSISSEMKFPKAESLNEKKVYELIDQWNLTFHKSMGFQESIQKMILRRVSSRYLSIIQSHCNLLLDVIRASDEIDPDHNDDILMLNLSLYSGELPG